MTGQAIQSKNLVAIGLAIICLAVGYYLYTNTFPQYTNTRLLLNQTNTEKQNLTTALASIEEFLSQYEKIEMDGTRADLLLPTETPDVANFINNLSNLATESGVTLGGFQMTESADRPANNAIRVADVSFSSSGSYLALRDFLIKLQNNLRLMDIYSVSMSASQQAESGTPLLQYRILLRTYYQ